jgi:hypothetical protein
VILVGGGWLCVSYHDGGQLPLFGVTWGSVGCAGAVCVRAREPRIAGSTFKGSRVELTNKRHRNRLRWPGTRQALIKTWAQTATRCANTIGMPGCTHPGYERLLGSQLQAGCRLGRDRALCSSECSSAQEHSAFRACLTKHRCHRDVKIGMRPSRQLKPYYISQHTRHTPHTRISLFQLTRRLAAPGTRQPAPVTPGSRASRRPRAPAGPEKQRSPSCLPFGGRLTWRP